VRLNSLLLLRSLFSLFAVAPKRKPIALSLYLYGEAADGELWVSRRRRLKSVKRGGTPRPACFLSGERF
jgi:hypothetical protein